MATKAQSTKDNNNEAASRDDSRGQSDNMEDSPMMANLHKALTSGKDVGHYGRLVFAMVARHFMDEGKVVDLLAKQPGQDEAQARALVEQVVARDYNPPRRERILEWQSQQDFVLCPNSDDPNACNLYSELRFPESVYDNINEYYEEQADGTSGN